jgi:hypothetical protein
MPEVDEIAEMSDRIRLEIPRVKSGTLRFWGEWFGRPYDNVHRIIGCMSVKDCLTLHFNEGETLSIWSPSLVTANQRAFRVEDAEHVRWEWFFYGRVQSDENRFFMDFQKVGGKVTASTNVNWYKPALRPTTAAPEVELL